MSVCVIICPGGYYPNHFQSHSAHEFDLEGMSSIFIWLSFKAEVGAVRVLCAYMYVTYLPKGLLRVLWYVGVDTEAASYAGDTHTA